MQFDYFGISKAARMGAPTFEERVMLEQFAKKNEGKGRAMLGHILDKDPSRLNLLYRCLRSNVPFVADEIIKKYRDHYDSIPPPPAQSYLPGCDVYRPGPSRPAHFDALEKIAEQDVVLLAKVPPMPFTPTAPVEK